MIKKVIIGLYVGGVLFAQDAYALTQAFSAAASFVAPLSVSSVTNPSFGKLTANVGATVYKLNTSGVVSVVSGPGSTLGGSPAAGSMTIAGSSTQTINIGASNMVSDAGVLPSAATCKYNNGSEVSCNDSSLDNATAPGSGKQLKVGISITTAGTEVDTDAAAPSFDVTVVYN